MPSGRLASQPSDRRSRGPSGLTRQYPATRGRTLNVSIAHNGVCSAGFKMKVQPAASAGAIFRVIIEIG